MFQKESELVDKLVFDLQERFGTQYIVKELRSGNNIADVTYTIDICRNSVLFNEYYSSYLYFSTIYQQRMVNLKELKIKDKTQLYKFNTFLQELEAMGYIRINGSYIQSIKKVTAVTTNFVAIEAKLSDWKSGLEQAKRYKLYANEVYVALCSDYINRVDKSAFIDQNIGLMSVSSGKLKISIVAKRQKPASMDVHYYVVDKFLRQLQLLNLLSEH